MSRSKEDNSLKNVILVVAIVAAVLFLLKKLAAWLSKLDDDSFKWETKPQSKQPVVPETVWKSESGVEESVSKPTTKNVRAKVFDLSPRQEEMYQLIRTQSKVTMQDVLDQIKDVSDRTLRRDMNKLEKLGLIERAGKTKNSIYRLKK